MFPCKCQPGCLTNFSIMTPQIFPFPVTPSKTFLFTHFLERKKHEVSWCLVLLAFRGCARFLALYWCLCRLHFSFLFYISDHPIFCVGTFHFFFSLPRRSSDQGSLSRLFSPPCHYGTRLDFQHCLPSLTHVEWRTTSSPEQNTPKEPSLRLPVM